MHVKNKNKEIIESWSDQAMWLEDNRWKIWHTVLKREGSLSRPLRPQALPCSPRQGECLKNSRRLESCVISICMYMHQKKCKPGFDYFISVVTVSDLILPIFHRGQQNLHINLNHREKTAITGFILLLLVWGSFINIKFTWKLYFL